MVQAPTQKQAQAFFTQMATYSARVLKKFGLPEAGSPNGGARWAQYMDRAPGPIGAALHWTASDNIMSALRWFCDPASKVSAHMVVADRKLPWAEHFAGNDCPLVASLPVTAVMCRPPDMTAWHVRDLDGVLFGIENQNVGEVLGNVGGQTYVSNGARVPYRSDKQAVPCFGRQFEPYTFAQCQANVDILAYVHAYFDKALKPSHVLGHSCYQSAQTNQPAENKTDPGPLLPLDDIRRAVFSPQAAKLQPDMVDGAYALRWRAQIVRVAMSQFRQIEGVYSKAALGNLQELSDQEAWLTFVRSCCNTNLFKRSDILAHAAMAVLGFHSGADASASDKSDSVFLCQRLLGVRVDGIIGDKTASALVTRLRALLVKN